MQVVMTLNVGMPKLNVLPIARSQTKTPVQMGLRDHSTCFFQLCGCASCSSRRGIRRQVLEILALAVSGPIRMVGTTNLA